MKKLLRSIRVIKISRSSNDAVSSGKDISRHVRGNAFRMAAHFRGEVPRMFFFFIRSFIEDPSDATSGFAADPGSPVTEGFAADPGSPVTEGFAADPGSPVTAGFADASGFCRYFRTLPGSCVFAGPAPFRTVSGSRRRPQKSKMFFVVCFRTSPERSSSSFRSENVIWSA